MQLLEKTCDRLLRSQAMMILHAAPRDAATGPIGCLGSDIEQCWSTMTCTCCNLDMWHIQTGNCIVILNRPGGYSKLQIKHLNNFALNINCVTKCKSKITTT